MEPAVFIEGEPSATANDVEYVTVSLMDPTLLTTVESLTGRLKTDGSLVLNYTVAASSNSYYIKVKTRNLIETWSGTPVILGPVTNYDFSNNNLKAYQDINNTFTQQYEVEPGVWAMYNGDVNQDGTIDGQDFNDTETDVNNFAFGYFATDIFNAGPVDGQDFNQLELNSGFFLFVAHP